MSKKKFKQTFDKFLDEKLTRLDGKQKIAILVAAIALPLALFYFLLYSPKQQEITKLEGNKAKLEREIASLKTTASKIKEHQAKIAETEARFKIASVLIPDQKEIPTLLTNISSLATNSGLEVLSFKPRGEAIRDFYSEIPVDIQVKGSYHNFGYFLYQVSKLPRIVTVSNVKMGSPKREGGNMQLSTDFNLVTYRFLDQSEQQANEQAKAKDGKKKGKRK
jgi:type IV pilus assembly protein PilO